MVRPNEAPPDGKQEAPRPASRKADPPKKPEVPTDIRGDIVPDKKG